LAVDDDPAVLAAMARDERGAGPDVRAKRRRGAGGAPFQVSCIASTAGIPDDKGAKQQQTRWVGAGAYCASAPAPTAPSALAASESRAGNERRRTAIGSEVEQRRTGRSAREANRETPERAGCEQRPDTIADQEQHATAALGARPPAISRRRTT
jgi:hypothetical protein